MIRYERKPRGARWREAGPRRQKKSPQPICGLFLHSHKPFCRERFLFQQHEQHRNTFRTTVERVHVTATRHPRCVPQNSVFSRWKFSVGNLCYIPSGRIRTLDADALSCREPKSNRRGRVKRIRIILSEAEFQRSATDVHFNRQDFGMRL